MEEVKKNPKDHTDLELKDGQLFKKIKYPWYVKLWKVPLLVFKYYLIEPFRKKAREKAIGDFLIDNKRLLIIVADPQTDKLIMGYKGKVVVSHIKSTDNKQRHIVRKMLKHSQFKHNIDGFLQGLSSAMQLKIAENLENNQFFHWIDGALYNISKSLSKKYGKENNK